MAEVAMRTTRVFADIMAAWLGGKRGILLQGGTSSTKTWSVMQFLHLVASSAKSDLIISVTSESLPHLKLGCIRDYFRIISSSPDIDSHWSKTEFVYKYPRALLEFWGADNEGKARGPRRHILFVNEGNNVPWGTVEAAEVRTEKFIIVDWNPTGEFWAHNYESGGTLVPGWLSDPRFAYSHSTYLDAKDVLPQSVIEAIEAKRDRDPNWWSIYGLGLTGNVEGLVYPAFKQVKELPKGDYFYGLDFGYVDPAVLTKHVIVGDCLYSQELICETGLTNDVLARKMDLLGVRKNYDEIFADSAEPKSIEEIALKGFNIKPCEKGQGSVEYGIQKVNQYLQFWTEGSLNCIKEQRNFRRIEDKNGKFTEKTTHDFSHGMDSRRYAVSSHIDRVGGSSNKILIVGW